VLDGLVRGVGVVADRRSNAGNLVAGDRRADAGATGEDPALGGTVQDRGADPLRDDGEVDGRFVEGAKVLNFVAVGAQAVDEDRFQPDPGVVAAYREPHRATP
jgi:hypothetical protein